jgi:hypothetical protein
VKDVLPLLRKQRDLEIAFVTEMAGKPEPSSGWTPSMTMFHIAIGASAFGTDCPKQPKSGR